MKIAISNRDACGLGSMMLRVQIDQPNQDVYIGAGDTKILDVVEGSTFGGVAYRSKVVTQFDPITGAKLDVVNDPTMPSEKPIAPTAVAGENKPVNVVPADISAQATPLNYHEGGVQGEVLAKEEAAPNPENAPVADKTEGTAAYKNVNRPNPARPAIQGRVNLMTGGNAQPAAVDNRTPEQVAADNKKARDEQAVRDQAAAEASASAASASSSTKSAK